MEQQAPMQGEDVMKEALAGLQAGAEADLQAAQMIGEMGQQEAADLLAQSANMKMEALKMLTGGGGAKPEAEAMGAQAPDVAGTGAKPVTMATR